LTRRNLAGWRAPLGLCVAALASVLTLYQTIGFEPSDVAGSVALGWFVSLLIPATVSCLILLAISFTASPVEGTASWP
jgi:hypothetical protein